MMNDVERFLAHAIEVERSAARRYEELAVAMGTDGNVELRKFFAQMAHFSRLHLAEARERGGFRELPDLQPSDYDWPDGTAPEVAEWAGVDAFMEAGEALQLALRSEQRAHAYYAAVAASSPDPDTRRMAAEFAAEELDHANQLERLIAARLAG